MKRLPVGIQTFEDIIQENYLYIDKTDDIYRLISEGKGYFLSRPRRFGKSLLVSTLDAIFSAKKDLFKGLAISEKKYDWKKHPVLRFDFSGIEAGTPKELEQELCYQIDKNAVNQKVSLKAEKSNQKLDELLGILGKKKSVILVDEYDKPILDNLKTVEQAEKIRDKLKGFYEVMKKNNNHLRFRLVTGVSKFSHTSLFSGDNILENITMANSFATMLGYTQEEVENCFDEHIKELAGSQKKTKKETLEEIMNWYNGYQFSEEGGKVYNPYSTLLLFKNKRYKNYWFESGTPSFLLTMLTDRGYGIGDVEGVKVDDTIFSSYDLSDLNLEGLLYETGYLTIKEYNEDEKLYTIGYPNKEVKESLVKRLLNKISPQRTSELLSYTKEIASGFSHNNLDKVFYRVNTILSRIPHQLFTRYESHYHSLIHLIFEYAGLHPHSEESVRGGDIDMTVETENNVYVLEFKTKENKGINGAFTQMDGREYARKYETGTKGIVRVAVELDTENRKVTYEGVGGRK